MQGVPVRHHHHGPGLPHLGELGVAPEVAPIELPDLGSGDDAGLDPRRRAVRLGLRAPKGRPFGSVLLIAHIRLVACPCRCYKEKSILAD